MSDTITFLEFPIGTANPTFVFADNVITTVGLVEPDGSAPLGVTLAASPPPDYFGPVFVHFQNPVVTASFDGGYFDNVGSTEVRFIGSDGSILSDIVTDSAGYLHFSWTITGDVGISEIQELVISKDPHGFGLDTVTISSPEDLFTVNDDQVDFNHLTGQQQIDIQNGSQIYIGLGGNDTVVLPSVANYNESVGAGKTLGWTGTPASQFFTSSKPGNNYNVSGSDGNYYIVGGSGTDNIVISGSGSSYFTPGSGTEAVTIKGGGYVKATGILTGSSTIGSSGSTLEITQPNAGTITFDPVPQVNGSAGSGGTLIIDGTNFPTNGTISGLQIGDTIDLKDVSFSGGGAIGLTSGNILQVIEGGKSYLLRLGGTTSDYNSGSWRLSSDGHSGTNIQFVSGLTINFSWDPSVKNADSGFKPAISSAGQYFQNTFTNAVTLNFLIGYGQNPSGGGTPMAANAIGESLPTFDTGGRTASLTTQPLASVTSALSAMNAPGAAFLPATGPAGRTLWLDPGEAIALGLISNGGAIIDGDVAFGAGVSWTYSGAVGTSSYDIIGTAEHEISELMGRRDDLDGAGHYDPFDLFMYTSSGAHDYVVLPIKPSAYFSIDGGATNLGFLNTNPAGDLNDWKSGANPPNSAGFVDPYNTPSSQGVIRRAGVADATVMSALGWKTSAPASAVSSGSIIISAILSAGGAVLNVLSGGVASAVQLYSGAKEIVSGLDVGAVVSDGAFQFLAAGGSAINTILNDPGIQVVSSGATASGAVLSSGAQQRVSSGGMVVGTVVSTGAFQIVSSGSANSTTLNTSAFQYLYTGATATSTAVASGAIQYVLAGALATSTTISGGAFQVDSGTANATIVNDNAIQYVYAGATASGTTVKSHSFQNDYGSAFATTLSSGAIQNVFSGGLASGTTMASGAIQQVVVSGGTASNTSVVSGAFQVVRGSANITTLAAGAKEYVSSGGVASNTTVGSGALLYIVSGGTATSITVNGGLLYDYGSASSATLSGAGTLGYVFNGGVATNLSVVGSGVTEQINVGGILSGGSVLSGALEYILGSANSVLVSGAGALMQMIGAATSISIGSGGIEVVSAGKIDSAATITLGGDQIVLATATAVSATVATSGRQDVLGSASVTTVSGFNGRMVISSGGHATGDRIFSGGVETINNGAATTGTFLSGIDGGQQATETVNAGGIARDTSVGSGARILVVGGTTSNAEISAGGTELVSNGGIASDTTISGGTVTVLSGGVASGAIVEGGNLLVSNGGRAVDATVFSGNEHVSSGGIISGATLSGGTLEILSGGSAGTSLITISSGTLILDDSQHFSGSIAGLATSGAQNVDLVDIAFATLTLGYTSNTGSGVLSASDGLGHTALLNMIGTYTLANFSTKAADDDHGGTMITDPPVSSGLAPPH